MRLSPKLLDLLQTSIEEVYRFQTIDEFREALPSLMLAAIRADHFAYHVCQLLPEPKFLAYEESSNVVPLDAIERWAATMEDHPFTQYYIRTGDNSPLRLSDFVPQWKFTEITAIRENLVPYGIRYTLSAPMIASPGIIGALTFSNRGRDFTESDRTLLALLRPHIAQARRNAEQVSALKANQDRLDLEERDARVRYLTKREREVGHWLCMGKTNAEIGLLLNASPRTIEKHVQSVLTKLGAENRTTAALILKAGRPRVGS